MSNCYNRLIINALNMKFEKKHENEVQFSLVFPHLIFVIQYACTSLLTLHKVNINIFYNQNFFLKF